MKFGMFYGALLILLVLGGCVVPPPSPPVVPPAMKGVLLERLEENARSFRSLEGLAKIQLDTGDRTIRGTQLLFAEKPDRLRAETLNPFGFGQPVLQVAASGELMTVFVPGEGRFYRGAASSENLARFTRLPLQLHDLVRLLLYDVPLLPYDRAGLSASPGEYCLTLAGGGGVRQELRFDLQQRLFGAAYFVGDALQLEVGYDRFTEGSHPFPQVMRLTVPGSASEASLVFSELRTNVAIPAERFSLTPPAGVDVHPFP